MKDLKRGKIDRDIISHNYTTQFENNKSWKFENARRQGHKKNIDVEILHRMLFYSFDPTFKIETVAV
jgi:hypothetical protein